MMPISPKIVSKILVSHSVLHPDFVREEVCRRYDLGENLRCFLLYRGINDVYLIEGSGRKYALRAWRKTWRKPQNVEYELSFLSFLRERGFPASSPVSQNNGDLWFAVDAPEGRRPLALYTWAPGVKFTDCLEEAKAQEIGALFAQMHELGREWAGGSHLFSTKNAKEFRIAMPHLLEFAHDRPNILADYPGLADRLAKRLDELHDACLPMGVCHRDLHPSNVHVDTDGAITFLDFDAIGEDFLMQDLLNYTWGNHFYGFAPKYAAAFEQGYDSRRMISQEEREQTDVFLLAKTLRLLSGMAMSSSAVGRGTLRFRSFEWLDSFIRKHARRAGLL